LWWCSTCFLWKVWIYNITVFVFFLFIAYLWLLAFSMLYLLIWLVCHWIWFITVAIWYLKLSQWFVNVMFSSVLFSFQAITLINLSLVHNALLSFELGFKVFWCFIFCCQIVDLILLIFLNNSNWDIYDHLTSFQFIVIVAICWPDFRKFRRLLIVLIVLCILNLFVFNQFPPPYSICYHHMLLNITFIVL